MGAGIAKTIRLEFPASYQADLTGSTRGDRAKLGSYTKAVITHDNGRLVVINGYTQFDYRRRVSGRSPVNYEAIREVFQRLRRDLPHTARIGIPKIGAGLAGGIWDLIKAIIDEETHGIDVTVVCLS